MKSLHTHLKMIYNLLLQEKYQKRNKGKEDKGININYASH